ncbi:hypothetical protein BDP27DRAFT_1334272 [Rhodocollybia butyracea]|uniref:Uncharacterized protein n=1 Tax=Rhodocollybia butyracea TaxID=206335 RepID=A0A9P5PL34_9AGAR|nr:hypothetical protein BDP27DRAFT_1334272 [Rhodocollybia butyracea]
MSRRSSRLAIPRPETEGHSEPVLTRNRASQRAPHKVNALDTRSKNEDEEMGDVSSTTSRRRGPDTRPDNDDHLTDNRIKRIKTSQRLAKPSQEDFPMLPRNTDTEITLFGQSSHPPTNHLRDLEPSASAPYKTKQILSQIVTDLYTETCIKDGENVYYESKMHESKEDFAIRLKEMKARSIREGLKMNQEIRERRLKDSPKTHMTKPGPDGVPIELTTHHARWEYYKELLDAAVDDVPFDGVQREWSHQELDRIAAAHKTFVEAADQPFRS